MKNTENLVVVHLSATAVYAVIGCVESADKIDIMGVGKVKNESFQQGQIKHWDGLKKSIKQAIFLAEEMANCRVHSVWLTLSTPELISKNSFGKVAIDNGTVETKDIVHSLSIAKDRDMPNTHYLMHHCQQGIMIDDQEHMVDDAIDMYANEVTVMYHLMMMPVASRQNMQRLLQSCDVSIDHMLFDAVSSAEYSLMLDERHHGTCLIDIGATTISVCMYSENKMIFTHCAPEGGNKVTMDISAELGITMAEAEMLKKRHGTVDVKSIDPSQFVTIKRVDVADEVTVSLLALAEIIEARYIAMFESIFSVLDENGLVEYINSGVVLSGGGSLMRGMIPFAKRYLNMPVFLTNQHPAINAYNHFDDDEKNKYLSQCVQDREYQTAFGVLLYSQSEQFKHSEKSSPDSLKVNKLVGLRQKLNKILHKVL